MLVSAILSVLQVDLALDHGVELVPFLGWIAALLGLKILKVLVILSLPDTLEVGGTNLADPGPAPAHLPPLADLAEETLLVPPVLLFFS